MKRGSSGVRQFENLVQKSKAEGRGRWDRPWRKCRLPEYITFSHCLEIGKRGQYVGRIERSNAIWFCKLRKRS